MEPEKFSTSALYWLCKEAENRSSAVDSPSPAAAEEGVPMPEETVPTVEKRRRGRPPKGESAKKRGKVKKKEDEDEDVCFICFDGGSLVLCDRGDCPKAYHPACIKRDEAFFQTNARWTCGWHICSKCEKSVSRYMCYTCTYSLCKGCTKDADYLCIRGNKGLCSTCYRVVMMIENIGQENKDMVQVDFDDKLSWEYLFKVYWICLKKDLSLTIDEITRAQRPCIAPNKATKREKASTVNYLDKKRNTARENPILPNQEISNTSVKSICDINNTSIATTSCATKELLDFIAHVRNGDMSVLSQTEVQALLFDYVKINNLRDPQQRSEIICDSKLENLFKKPRVRHFEMLSLLEFHFLKKDDPRKYEIKNYISHHVGPVTGESNSDTVNLPMICENSKEKVNMKDEEITNVSMGNEGTGAFEKPEIHVGSSESVNNGPIANSLSGSKSEAMVASLSTGNMPSSTDKGRENLWHYRDPSGKVQGPFGIKHFHKWSLTGTFPPDMRIWRLNTEERDSILLVDVIKGQIGLHNNLSLSLQEVKNISADTSRHCEESSSGNLVSAAVNTDAHSNGKLEFDKGIEPVIRNDPQINSDAKIENPSNYLNQDPDPDRPKVISPQVHFTEKPREISKNEKWSKAGQIQISALNNENLSSQEKKASAATAGQCHIIQRNGQNISDQPSSDGPFCQNVSVKNWNFHKPDPQYASMADLNAPSEQKLTISFQDVPMPVPKAITEELQSQTIKPMANLNDDSEQKLTINFQDVPTPVPKTITEELQSQTIKPMANLNEDSEQKFTINFQDVPMPVLKTSTEELQSQTIKPMANLNDDSKQKFTINFQDVPMPVPKTSTVELQPQTIKLKRKSSKTRTEKVKGKDMKRENSLQIKDQIRFQNNLSLSPQEGKNAFNSTFHHYDDPPNGNAKFVEIDTDANIKGKIELAMSNEPVGHISYSAAPVISNDPQINLDAKIGNSFKHLDPPKFINSYSDQPQVHSLEGSSTFTMKPHKDSVHEDRNLVSQTTGGQYHKSQINEKFYLDRPSLDQNSSVNNWNYHKFHPDNTLTAKPNDVSEQRFHINLQDFPMPMPKTSTEDLQSHTKLIDHDEKDHSRNQKTDHLINNYNKSQVTDNELSLSSNCHWNGGETYLPKEATKPSSKEWDSCFLSVSSFKPQAGENDHVTTSTSKSVEFPPPSPPNPVPNASSWLAMVTEPIEFNTLAEESVSDLLAEVDAMESNSDQASPNLLMDYADDLFQDSKTDCFSSLRGLSFSLDRGKNNEIDDTVLPPQSTMREEPILTQNDSVLDPLKKPPKHSSTSSILKVETKRGDIPDNQSEFRSYRPNPSPKKKTRDLSEIMNGPTKHVKLKTHGLNRRESEERTPRGSSSKNRSTSSGRESHQKHVGERLTSPREQNHSSGGERLTSPREHNHSSGGERLTSPRERNHSSGGERLTSPRDRNAPGGDSGFSKGRSSWSRQSSIGSGIGGHSRSLSRGQRVCKFYESGYCRKGAFCEYLHP